MVARDNACELSVGVIPVQDFTMLAMSAFVDTLRLAADEGDRSRPLRCAWRVMSDGGRPVRASNGIMLQPTGGFVDPSGFDYVVIVGGTLHGGPEISSATQDYLRTAANRNVPLVGLCTGSFILARAGLMKDRRACVSWFHKDELLAEFPDLEVVGDALYVFDRDRITCAGGTSVIHLASELVDRHLGAGSSDKGLRVMLEDRLRGGGSPQPPPTIEGLESVADPRVRRAMLMIERTLDRSPSSESIACSIGITRRHLARLFNRALGLSPRSFAQRLRLQRAHRMITEGTDPMTTIALACGYSDASHFSREYYKFCASSPSEARAAAANSLDAA